MSFKSKAMFSHSRILKPEIKGRPGTVLPQELKPLSNLVIRKASIQFLEILLWFSLTWLQFINM